MMVCTGALVMKIGLRGEHARVGIFLLAVVTGGLLNPLSADAGKPSKAKNTPAASLGEAVRLANDPGERAEKLADFRRRMLELDFEAWQALVDGNFDAACEAKAEELRQTKSAHGDADPWTQFTAWGAESFDVVRTLPSEQREIVHQAARSDRSGQRLRAQGSRDRARVHLRLAAKNYRDVLGDRSQITIYGIHRLAEVEMDLGDFPSAYSNRSEMLQGIGQKLDEKNTFALWASGQLALVEGKLDRAREAEARWHQIITVVEPLMGDNPQPFVSQLYATGHQHLARLANERGESALAESHARQALAVAAVECAMIPTPESRAAVLLTEIELAISCAEQGRGPEADRAFDSVLRFINSFPDETAPVGVQVRLLSKFAEHCRRSKRISDAEKLEAKVARLESPEKTPEKTAERPAEDQKTR